jgi:enoyl-CoA hydratase/carnithine racemase
VEARDRSDRSRKIRHLKGSPVHPILKYFSIDIREPGIGVVTFNRPPVNAVSFDVYTEIRAFSQYLNDNDDVRVVVIVAPKGARAWCGGADLNDFLELDSQKRRERYAYINECVPHFANLSKPVIAAMNGPAVGVGMVLASLCDMRVGADDAFLALPEIDRGVVAGGGSFFKRLSMPDAFVREMMYSGRRFSTQDVAKTGFFNYVMPRDQVLDKAIEMADIIARKSLPALVATKKSAIAAETMTWMDAYVASQEYAATLTGMGDAKEGIRAFLEKRDPSYADT